MIAIFTLLLLFAAVATAALSGMVFSFHESDAAGQGMTKGFAFVAAILAWLGFGALLLFCASRGRFTGWMRAIVPIVYLAAASAQLAALSVLEDLERGERFEAALRFAVIAAPCLTILYCALTFFQGLPERTLNLGLGLPVAALAVIPWLLMPAANAAISARVEARDRAYQEREERERRLIAEINALPPDAPLAAFLRYTDSPPGAASDSRQAALARMSKLAARQSAAVDLLQNQGIRLLRDLGDLDLTMTPALCAAGRQSALQLAEHFNPTNPAPPFESIESSVSAYFSGVQWLLKNGCDCKPEIAALEQTVRLYPVSYPRGWFTDYLLELQGKPREVK